MGLSRTLRGWLGTGGGVGTGRGGGGRGGRGSGAFEVAALGLEAAERRALLDALRGLRGGGEQGEGVDQCRLEVSGRWLRVSATESLASRAHALIFVVDATDSLRIVVCREELSRYLALSHGVAPLLVLVANADKPHALPIDKLAQGLGLPLVLCRGWHIGPLSALREALDWLVAQTVTSRRDLH